MAGVYLRIVWQYKEFLGYRVDYLFKIIGGACAPRSSRENGIP